MTSNFINVLESFGLQQSVNGPTHVKGHTIDSVLSSGGSIFNPVMEDFNLSDYTAIIFYLDLPHAPPVHPTLLHSHILDSEHYLQKPIKRLPSLPVSMLYHLM